MGTLGVFLCLMMPARIFSTSAKLKDEVML
jgi:hypothetical protein